MKYAPRISSDFAILDVKGGRKALDKAMMHSQGVRYKIIIEAEFDNTWSGDDGVSQEFALNVTKMQWVAEEP